MSVDNGDRGESTPLNRRQLIKKAAAGAAAAGVVWSAPRVEGLTLRPDYAAAGSSPVFPINAAFLSFDYNFDSQTTANANTPLGNGTLNAATAQQQNNANNTRDLRVTSFTYTGNIGTSANLIVNAMTTNTGNVTFPYGSVGIPLGSAQAQVNGPAPHDWTITVCN